MKGGCQGEIVEAKHTAVATVIDLIGTGGERWGRDKAGQKRKAGNRGAFATRNIPRLRVLNVLKGTTRVGVGFWRKNWDWRRGGKGGLGQGKGRSSEGFQLGTEKVLGPETGEANRKTMLSGQGWAVLVVSIKHVIKTKNQQFGKAEWWARGEARQRSQRHSD